MEKGLFKKILLLITYTVVLVAIIVKLDAIGGLAARIVSAFKPLLIGFAIAFVLDRPCNFFAGVYAKWLPDKAAKAARPLAVVTAYVILTALIAALIALVVPELVRSIEAFMDNLSAYGANLQDLLDLVADKLGLETLAGLDLSGAVDSTLGELMSDALDLLTNTLPHLITVTSVVVSGVVTGVLALVFSVYMLSGGPRLVAQCRRLAVTYLPKKLVKPVLSVARLTADTFTRYVSGQITEAFILGCLCFVGMCVFRFDYAPLISVIIGVSALIPVAGAYIGAIVAVILLVMIEPIQALWFLVFLVVLQQVETNFIYPRVVGATMGLPGIWVLAAVTVGSSLLGFAGLVVSVPVAAVLYTLLKRDLNARAPAAEEKEAPEPEEPPEEK